MSLTYVGLAVLEAKATAALTAAITQSAEDLVGKAQAATPVLTGTLKASIHFPGISAGGMSATAKVATGGEASEYAFYRHQGTSKMTGVPYLEVPLLANVPVYTAALQAAVAGAF